MVVLDDISPVVEVGWESTLGVSVVDDADGEEVRFVIVGGVRGTRASSVSAGVGAGVGIGVSSDNGIVSDPGAMLTPLIDSGVAVTVTVDRTEAGVFAEMAVSLNDPPRAVITAESADTPSRDSPLTPWSPGPPSPPATLPSTLPADPSCFPFPLSFFFGRFGPLFFFGTGGDGSYP